LASLNDVLGVEFNDVFAPLNGVQYTIYRNDNIACSLDTGRRLLHFYISF
jgi:hypothetical protein